MAGQEPPVADDALSVNVTANVDDLVKKLGDASTVVNESMGKIGAAANDAAMNTTGSMKSIAESVSSSTADVASKVSSLGDTLAGISGKISAAFKVLGVAAVIHTINSVNDAIVEMGHHSTDVQNLAAAFGITATQMEGLIAIAIKSGVTQEQLAMGLTRVSNAMELAKGGSTEMQQKLSQLGVTMVDLYNPAFNAVTAMIRMGQSAGTNAELLSLYGRNGYALVGMTRQLAGGFDSVSDAAARSGALTDAQRALLVSYAEKVDLLGIKWQNVKSTLASGVVDDLGRVVDIIDHGVASTPKWAEAIEKRLVPAILGMIPVVGPSMEVAVRKMKEADEAAASLQARTGTIPRGPPAPPPPPPPPPTFTAVDASKEQQARLDAVKQEAEDEIEAKQQSLQKQLSMGQISLAEYIAQDKALIEAKLAAETSYLNQKKALDAKAAEQSIAGDIAVLNAREANDTAHTAAYEAQKRALQASSRAAEIKDDADLVHAKEEAQRSELELAQQLAESDIAINLKAAEAKYEGQMRTIEAQIAAEQNLFKVHQVTAAQTLSVDAALFAQEKQLTQAFYAYKIQIDGQSTMKILESSEQLQQRLAAISAKQVSDTQLVTSQITKEWALASKNIADLFANDFVKMLRTGQSFSQMMRGFFASMADDIIKNLIKIGVQHELTAIMSKTADTSAAKTSMFADAAAAASAAMKAVAGIPFIGPALALAAGAAVYAAAIAFPIPSAAGGWDVPGDTLAMVHEREMILPENISTGLKQMIATGGGGATNINLAVHALDSKSVDQMFKTPAGRKTITDGLMQAYRRGVKGTRR